MDDDASFAAETRLSQSLDFGRVRFGSGGFVSGGFEFWLV